MTEITFKLQGVSYHRLSICIMCIVYMLRVRRVFSHFIRLDFEMAAHYHWCYDVYEINSQMTGDINNGCFPLLVIFLWCHFTETELEYHFNKSFNIQTVSNSNCQALLKEFIAVRCCFVRLVLISNIFIHR